MHERRRAGKVCEDRAMDVTEIVAMWGLAQGALGELDVDVAAHARLRFDRLARIAEEPSFVAALG